jgi:hypothetical protein
MVRLCPIVEGLEGRLVLSSIVAQHPLEITEISVDVENPSTIGSATQGAGAGKVKFNAF